MDEMCEIAINLVMCAGDSRSSSMKAIQAAREFRFDDANALIREAEEKFVSAHEIQTKLIQREAAGEKNEVILMMVHAQDHLSMAMTTYENAKEFLNLYQLINKLQ
ncbi:MAG: PTS lactose/cellobiose transporter subunit IIA [Lachnospiraceae bacterium]|nr:PTS lactose/cellobiose transporter subunit IIA [Lachnospiraceae bacterium]